FRSRPEPLVGGARRQEFLVACTRHRPQPDAHARLLVPDLVAGDRAEPELRGGAGAIVQRALVAQRQRVPPAHELLDRRGHVEEVLDELLQRDRAAWRQREQARVERERLVRHARPSSGGRCDATRAYATVERCFSHARQKSEIIRWWKGSRESHSASSRARLRSATSSVWG